jgi:hypothetical protein
MRLLLRDFCGQTTEFVQGSIDLALRFYALRAIHLDGGAGQAPVDPAGDRHHHLQITQ